MLRELWRVIVEVRESSVAMAEGVEAVWDEYASASARPLSVVWYSAGRGWW